MILKMAHDKRFDNFKGKSPLAPFTSDDLEAFIEGLSERLDIMNDAEIDSFYGGAISIVIAWDNGYKSYDINPADLFVAFYYYNNWLGNDIVNVYKPGMIENNTNWFTHEENQEAYDLFCNIFEELDVNSYLEWVEAHTDDSED